MRLPARTLSVSVEESGISTLSLVTLRMMWNKAEKLLNTTTAVTIAPGSDPNARMVATDSSAAPHFVSTHKDGQFNCDSNCPQWLSCKICFVCSRTFESSFGFFEVVCSKQTLFEFYESGNAWNA